MSLLGRLEDLSLTDIVQIVYLSRRTGVLEIINSSGRHTVLFKNGLVVNAASPEHPDLTAFLDASGLIPSSKATMVRQMEERGIPVGLSILDLNLLSSEDLAAAVHKRILSVVTPLLSSKEGEFNFILSEKMGALDVEYEPEQLFKEGGLAPGKLLGSGDADKLKPLRGLEESLKVGKALLRGSAPAEATPGSLNLGLGQPISRPATPEPEPAPAPPAPAPSELPAESRGDNVVPFRTREEFTPIDELPDLTGPGSGPAIEEPPSAPAARAGTAPGQFKVAGGLFEVESPDAAYRNVVLFERNPLVRVAARRAFSKVGVKISQFGSLEDVRGAMTELFRSNSFFVTFLELTEDEASTKLLQQLKRKNPRLPVVMIDGTADLRKRHDLLRSGADLYVTKPTPERLQPGLVEEELAMFADELVLFAERSFDQWQQVTGGGLDAGRKFYEMATKETMDRSFGLLRQLINELSNPNDIGQVSATILRLSAEYLDRGALFMVSDDAFVGLGGFGATGSEEPMDGRVRRLRIPRNEPSILAEVAGGGEAHRGKMRRTTANVQLIETLGGLLPTEVAALPIMHGTRAIGILYGDNAEHRGPIDSITGLEIFLSQAGYAFGNAVFASERAGRR
jgi:CheY-like chemotaxis protein